GGQRLGRKDRRDKGGSLQPDPCLAAVQPPHDSGDLSHASGGDHPAALASELLIFSAQQPQKWTREKPRDKQQREQRQDGRADEEQVEMPEPLRVLAAGKARREHTGECRREYREQSRNTPQRRNICDSGRTADQRENQQRHLPLKAKEDRVG